MIKNFIRLFLGYSITFFLLPYNLLAIFKNRKIIAQKDFVVIQTCGGYGHTFTMPDISKMLFSNNFFYIWFFEPSRHNIYLPKIFGIDYLTIFNSLQINFFYKRFELGEVEYFRIRIFRKILINFILLFSKGEVLIDNDIYRFSEKKYPKKINKKISIKTNAWLGVYYYLIEKKKNQPDLTFFENFFKKNNLKKIIKLKKNRKKNITVYLRNREGSLDNSNIRNGSDKNQYFSMLKYFVKKKMNIFLIGDKIFNKEDFKVIGGNVMDCHFVNKNLKQILRVYLSCISSIYVSEYGGGQYFGRYAKKWGIINVYPPNLFSKNTKVLFKKILNKDKLKYFYPNNKYIYLFYKKKIYNKKNIIKNNSSVEIMKFINEKII